MNFRNTLILVSIFAVLAGYVYFVEMQKPAVDTSAGDNDKYVLTLGEADVQALQVKTGDKSVYLVKDADGTWYVGGVGGAEAELYQVSSTLYSLAELKASRVITDVSAGPAAYGLEKPAAQVTMELSDGKSESLTVGDLTPQGSAYYVQRKGTSAIYLVSSYLLDGLLGWVANPPYLPTPTAAAAVPVTGGLASLTSTVVPIASVTATSPITR